jgi:uncharacterized membrane protein (Fun14 family)
MKIIALVIGVLAALLGGLWLLQGLGVVHIEPVACVAECETLEGPSMQWAVIGAIVVAAGLAAVFYGLRRPH